MLTGIGFTISLFIVDLAITDPVAQSDARIGILTASALAALIGVISLQLTARYDRNGDDWDVPVTPDMTLEVNP